MGLDNGINAKKIDKSEIPSWIKLPFDNIDNFSEFAYWRKCWGIRNEILGFLHARSSDEYEWQLDLEDLPGIIRILKKYLNEDYWNQNADSIWEFDEYFNSNLNNIINLTWLYNYWETHPEIEVYFYDSY